MNWGVVVLHTPILSYPLRFIGQWMSEEDSQPVSHIDS